MLSEQGQSHPAPSPKVLLIEDEEAVGEVMMNVLRRSGMRSVWATTGAEGLRLQAEFHPDIVLVDLLLPDSDGIVLVAWLVQHGDCGVIIVSGLDDETDRVLGLELGADDYIVKPPRLRELVARIRAVHRRVRLSIAPGVAVEIHPMAVIIGDLRIDVSLRTVNRLTGEPINLTAAEFSALETLLAAKGAPVSRDVLSLAALHRPCHAEDRSVDQLIFSLRRKLPGSEEDGCLIHSIRGTGYLLAAHHLPVNSSSRH